MRRLALLFFATTAFAAPPRIAIKAARLIDGRGNVAAPGIVVVRGNKIESVGGAVPDDAKVIDPGAAALSPGPSDAHVPVLLQATSPRPSTTSSSSRNRSRTAPSAPRKRCASPCS